MSVVIETRRLIARWALGVLVTVFVGACSISLTQAQQPGAITNLRPNPEGVPTVVTIAVFVIDIRDINDAKQSMTADAVLRMQWQDPRLAAGVDDTSAQPRILALDHVWNPQIHLINPISISKLAQDTVTVTPDGTVIYRQRFLGEVGVSLDLVNFPVDHTMLTFDLVSFDYTPEELQIVIDEARSGRASRLSIQGWTIGPISSKTDALSVSAKYKNLASVVYELPAERQIGFYLWKFIIPLSFIVFMSWAVFLIDPANLGVQIGVATSSVLTLIAFYLHLGSLLPKISFLTRLDDFIFGATVLVFLAFGEAISTAVLARIGQESRALLIDRWCRGLFPALFAVLIIYSFWL